MNVRILVFRGNLQNEGNVWALEFDENIFILGSGSDNPIVIKEQINIDYLKENKEKIKCFFLVNGSPKNSFSLKKIYEDLELKDIPIYGSKNTKENLRIFQELNNDILDNFIEIESQRDELTFSEKLKVSFVQIDSHYIGTLGIKIYDQDHCIYYIEDFSFNVLSSNNILFDQSFFTHKLRKFFSVRRKRTCLVSGCQNLGTIKNGSLFPDFKKVFDRDKKIFLIVYEFDFLHIIESFEIAQKLCINVNVLDDKMFNFLSKVFEGNVFSKIIRSNSDQDKNGIYLLTVSFDDLDQKKKFFLSEKKKQVIVCCLFPVSGSEERVAKFSDFLHSLDNEFIDLNRNDNLQIGTNFYDLKLILKILNPNIFVLLQNSYKNRNLISELKNFKPRIVPNESLLNISASSKKTSISSIKSTKKFITTEGLLCLQKERLLRNGLLLIFIDALQDKKAKKILLLKLKIFHLSISETIDFLKLEKKIRQWWEMKINSESNLFLDQNSKQIIEKRLSGLIRNYLSFENDIEIEEPLFLTFIGNKKGFENI